MTNNCDFLDGGAEEEPENITDMTDDQLEENNYVDEDGNYTDEAYDHMTEEDHDRLEEATLNIADRNED